MNDRIAGYVSYSIDETEELGFGAYLDDKSGAKGDKGEWFQPASFLFRDQEGLSYPLSELLAAFRQDNASSFEQWDAFVNILSSGSKDGAGHAVTVIGWDDTFKPSLIDYTDRFIQTYLKNISDAKKDDRIDSNQFELYLNLLLEFKKYLDGRSIEFNNHGDQSTGAWIIQNSWGNDSKQIIRQYLPYDMVDLSVTGDPQNFMQSVTGGAMFHYADASRSFGNVQSASTAVPASRLFDPDFKLSLIHI